MEGLFLARRHPDVFADLDKWIHRSNERCGAIHRDHGESSAGSCNRVAFSCLSLLSSPQCIQLGLEGALPLTKLVRCELAPYATRNNTDIDGPEIILRSEAGQAMAIALHELATSAAKYGALSTRNGRVSIRWDLPLNGQPLSPLVLEWHEIGGPPVVSRAKPNYGTSTIRDLIPYEFGGTVDLVLAPEGVRCRLELPSDWLGNHGEPALEEGKHTQPFEPKRKRQKGEQLAVACRSSRKNQPPTVYRRNHRPERPSRGLRAEVTRSPTQHRLAPPRVRSDPGPHVEP